jgi:hypothetical protein
MTRSKLTPVQKRAITMLRNSGIAVSLNVVPAAPAVPVIESPAPKIVCIEPGCYKEGHAFSPKGAFGVTVNGERTVKGHFDLNPTHALKSI